MARRAASATSFADAYVFPGGTVRDDDLGPGDVDALTELTRRGGTPPPTADAARGLYRAAIRELFEEAGVLLARDAAGATPTILDAESATWRARREQLQRGETSLHALLEELGLRPAFGELIYFSHWITPLGQPRRFDTRFFVAALPPGQQASHCGVELTDGVWLGPHDALGRYAAGKLPLVFPTRMHLQRLTGARSLDDLLEIARTKPIATIQPGRPGEDVGARW